MRKRRQSKASPVPPDLSMEVSHRRTDAACHGIRQVDVEIFDSGRPPGPQPSSQRLALSTREVDGPRRQPLQGVWVDNPAVQQLWRVGIFGSDALARGVVRIRRFESRQRRRTGATRPCRRGTAERAGALRYVASIHGIPDRRVERLVLHWSHFGVPVATARQHSTGRPATPALAGDQQVVEHVGRGHVEQNVREVLTADQVDVVHAQVDRRDLVARSASGAFPLDDQGQPPTQSLGGCEESPAVLPRGVEFRVVEATGAQLGQVLPPLRREAVHDGRAGADRFVDGSQPQHAKAGPELGHGGPVARHFCIFPWTRSNAAK